MWQILRWHAALLGPEYVPGRIPVHWRHAPRRIHVDALGCRAQPHAPCWLSWSNSLVCALKNNAIGLIWLAMRRIRWSPGRWRSPHNIRHGSSAATTDSPPGRKIIGKQSPRSSGADNPVQGVRMVGKLYCVVATGRRLQSDTVLVFSVSYVSPHSDVSITRCRRFWTGFKSLITLNCKIQCSKLLWLDCNAIRWLLFGRLCVCF